METNNDIAYPISCRATLCLGGCHLNPKGDTNIGQEQNTNGKCVGGTRVFGVWSCLFRRFSSPSASVYGRAPWHLAAENSPPFSFPPLAHGSIALLACAFGLPQVRAVACGAPESGSNLQVTNNVFIPLRLPGLRT